MLYSVVFLLYSKVNQLYVYIWWWWFSCYVMSDSLRPRGLWPARLLCPWDYLRQEYLSRLPCPPPGIFLTQGSNQIFYTADRFFATPNRHLQTAPWLHSCLSPTVSITSHHSATTSGIVLPSCFRNPTHPSIHSSGAKSCPTLCDPIDRGLPGSSVHGILQARTLESVAVSYSKGSS